MYSVHLIKEELMTAEKFRKFHWEIECHRDNVLLKIVLILIAADCRIFLYQLKPKMLFAHRASC